VAVLFATKRLLWISVQITEPSLSLNYRYKKCIHIDIYDKNNVVEIKNHIFVKINLIL